MKNIVVGLILSSTLALPALAALKQGTSAPDFSAQASVAGKDFKFSLAEALKKGPVVVYFYPSAYTGGCNIEAHTFAVNQEKFDVAGASILGVSHDSIARLNDFSADPEYCAGKFPVASDPDGTIAKSYDLKVMDERARRQGHARDGNRSRVYRAHHVRHRARFQDRGRLFVVGRQDLTRGPRHEVFGSGQENRGRKCEVNPA